MTFLTAEKLLRFNNKNTLLLLIAAWGCMLLFNTCRQRNIAASEAPETDMQQLTVTSLAGGSYCGIDCSMDLVITSRQEWVDIWQKVQQGTEPEIQAPEVDFKRESVLAVFLGTRPTGGYSVEISHFSEKDDIIKAFAKISSPSPGSMVTTALTQPFHIVRINISGKEIEIIRD